MTDSFDPVAAGQCMVLGWLPVVIVAAAAGWLVVWSAVRLCAAAARWLARSKRLVLLSRRHRGELATIRRRLEDSLTYSDLHSDAVQARRDLDEQIRRVDALEQQSWIGR